MIIVRGKTEYMVVIEKSKDGYGAYIPDLLGCVAVGDTRDEALQLIREAMELHLEMMEEEDTPMPLPMSTSAYVAVPA